ncbi:MAG: ABC transporter ATP-binding protein [Pirellulales bacterium]
MSALHQCNLKVTPGIITGLLGPNGAGKTTLLRTLMGFQRPTSGSASVCGFDCEKHSIEVRRRTAYLPGDARLFRSMTGRSVLEIFAGLSPHGDLGRCRRAAERLELDLSRLVMFMSTGMRQKLAIAIVLGSSAPLLILDEPTANLDPSVRNEVMSMVKEANREGRSVLLSSHIFSDIDDTCAEVVIMKEGRLVHQQSTADLKNLHIVRCTGLQAEDASANPFSRLVEPSVAPKFLVHHYRSSEGWEFHLTGDAKHWLSWVQQLPAADLRIQSAGVRALYERFHHCG